MNDGISYQFHVPTARVVVGPQQVLEELLRQTDHYSDLSFDIRAVYEADNSIIVERDDSFTLSIGGARVQYPVVAVFDFARDGGITAWREYWDRGALYGKE